MERKELITQALQNHLPEGKISLKDLTGTADHWEVTVADNSFAGLTIVDQHRMIYGALQSQFDDGTIHALSIITIIPSAESANDHQEEASEEGST